MSLPTKTLTTVRTISALELKALRDSADPPILIDVREPHEREICSIGGELIPLGQIKARHAEIPTDRKVIIYCRSGARSGRAVEDLQSELNFKNLYNLEGGILGWIEAVDPTLTPY
jgi:adenylyltransferase/sulfurtransferase